MKMLSGIAAISARFSASLIPSALKVSGPTENVAKPMADQRPVDGLGNKVCRASLECAIDGLRVVVSGHHNNGKIGALLTLAYYRTGLVVIRPGHFDIHQK